MSTGQIHHLELKSQLLKGNPLKNPHHRQVVAFTPPGYQGEPLPLLLYLPGFGSHPQKQLQKDFPVHRVIELLTYREEIPAVIFAYVDGYTRLGGSQYVDSSLNGPFASHILDEVVPFLENHFGAAGPHSIAGHSSGGFGAIHLASLRPNLFRGVASLAGDLHFELTHKSLLSDLVNDLEKGKIQPSLAANLKQETTHYVLGMAAAYSPDPLQRKWKMHFPIDPKTSSIDESTWKQWMRFDPCSWPRSRFKKLMGLKRRILSCGSRDNFSLHLGMQHFHALAEERGVPFLKHLHEGNHSLNIPQQEWVYRKLLN